MKKSDEGENDMQTEGDEERRRDAMFVVMPDEGREGDPDEES